MLLVAAAVRVAAATAYWPGLVTLDSLSYLADAYHDVWNTRVRPIGYPAVLHVLSVGGLHVGMYTVAQHLAGLVGGVLVYAVVRTGVNRPVWAALAAGVVLLDAYAIALEQFILSEPFFTLALVTSVYLSVTARQRPLRLMLAGLTLAAAVAMRSVGVFATVPWMAWVLISPAGTRGKLAGLSGVVLPLLLYVMLHSAAGRGLGITETPGWFLYGRVGEIADCRKARVPRETRSLCMPMTTARHPGATWYIWSPGSPTRKLFPGGPLHTGLPQRSSDLLASFALAVMRDQPVDFLRLIGADVVRFSTPGILERGDRVHTPVTFPADDSLQQRLVGSTRAFADAPELPARLRAPAHLLGTYARYVHTPRPAVALAVVSGLLAMLLALVRGARRVPHWRSVFLLTGMGTSLVLGAAATSEFAPRHLMP
ncbi:MAG: phospholipid carrier-dependent glycosyltransferase, partial [Actinobacteria bacterium]|nr:phospholipid carrier-dependent glycosyltransferase [Actinomycetota bacterium]